MALHARGDARAGQREARDGGVPAHAQETHRRAATRGDPRAHMDHVGAVQAKRRPAQDPDVRSRDSREQAPALGDGD